MEQSVETMNVKETDVTVQNSAKKANEEKDVTTALVPLPSASTPITTVARKRNRSTSKQGAQTSPSSGSTRKRPKRHAASPYDKYEGELTPMIKIKRTPGPSGKKSTNPSNVLYDKGSVVAVKNEFGSFYLGAVKNDVLTSDIDFTIIWIDNSKTSTPNLYTKSFSNVIRSWSVLCDKVALVKQGSKTFKLPQQQKDRILKCLRESNDEENFSSEDDLPLKATISSQQQTTVEIQTNKPPPRKPGRQPKYSKTINADEMNLIKSQKKANLEQIQQPRQPSVTHLPGPDPYRRPSHRGRPPRNQSTLNEGDHIQSSANAKTGNVNYLINPEIFSGANTRSNDKLVPNNDIEIVQVDPAFEPNNLEYLPKQLSAIHAVINKDFPSLSQVFESCDPVKILSTTRSVDVHMTCLHYALLDSEVSMGGDILMFLLQKLSEVVPFKCEENLLHLSNILVNPDNHTDGNKITGWLSSVEISKGSKEGNYAFIKDVTSRWSNDREFAREIARFCCKEGVSPDVLNILVQYYPATNDYNMKDLLFENYHLALDMGHCETLQFLLKFAKNEHQNGKSISKNNVLAVTSLTDNHLVVLSDKDASQLVNYNVKELKRKTLGGHKFQPVHFAACNPSRACLEYMIRQAKECAVTLDGRSRRPVHYAAACQTSHSLAFLKNVVNVEEQDTIGRTPLMVACEAGRHEQVQMLVQMKEVIIERPDRSNYCGIHLAAKRGHTSSIEALVMGGADINKTLSVSKARVTPLMLAASQGYLNCCMKIVELGGVVEMRDKLGRTALIHAAMNGHYPVVAFLLNKGANANNSDSSMNTPLHYASAYGWYHCVYLLLQAKANLHNCNEKKLPAIALAFLKDNFELVQLLSANSGNFNFKCDRGRTLLMQLLAEEKLNEHLTSTVQYLIVKHMPDPNVQDINNSTAMHLLALNKVSRAEEEEVDHVTSRVIGEMLVKLGCDVNLIDHRNRIALFLAALDGNIKLMNLLVFPPRPDQSEASNLSADQSASSLCPRSLTSQVADTFLHLVVRNWHLCDMSPIVHKLATNCKLVMDKLSSRRNKAGYTPLLLLCKCVYDQQQKLMENKKELDETAVKKFEKSIIECGKPFLESMVKNCKCDVSISVGKSKRNHKDVEAEGKTCAHFLSMITLDKNCILLKLLLSFKPNLNDLDASGASPLVRAVYSRNQQAVKVLLEDSKDIQPNLSSMNGNQQFPCPPLTLAVQLHGSREESMMDAIRSLLEKIPDINQVPVDPRNGRTPMMYAVEKEEELELVQLLLSANALLTCVDIHGRTPLHLAVNASQPDSILFDIPHYLIENKADLSAVDKYGRIPLHYAFLKVDSDNKELTSDGRYDPIELTTLLTSRSDKFDTADERGR